MSWDEFINRHIFVNANSIFSRYLLFDEVKLLWFFHEAAGINMDCLELTPNSQFLIGGGKWAISDIQLLKFQCDFFHHFLTPEVVQIEIRNLCFECITFEVLKTLVQTELNRFQICCFCFLRSLAIYGQHFNQQKGFVTQVQHFGKALVFTQSAYEGKVSGKDSIRPSWSRMESDIQCPSFRLGSSILVLRNLVGGSFDPFQGSHCTFH